MTVTFPPENLQRFNSLIKEMQRATGRDEKMVVRNSARDFCRAALRRTPIAQKDPFRKRRGRGFAKSGWVKALRGLGLSTGATLIRGGKGVGLRFGDFKDGRQNVMPFVEVANQVPYITQLDTGSSKNPPYHILSLATNDTMRKMERILNRMSTRMARRWISI